MAEQNKIYLQAVLLPIKDVDIRKSQRKMSQAFAGGSIPLVAKSGGMLQAQVKSVSVGLADATKRSKDFGEAVGNAAKRFAAYSTATFFLIRISRAFQGATASALEFESELVKIAQTANVATSEIKTQAPIILSISKKYGLMNAEVAKTVRILKQAGLSLNDAYQGAEILSRTTLLGTFEDLNDTTEGFISLMSTFKVSAREAGEALDFINVISKRYATESADYVSAIKRAGGVFVTTGGDVRELVSALTVVRDATRESADVIATGFRTIFPRLQRPKTIEFFEQMGIQLTKLEGGTRRFIGNLEAIVAIQKGLEQAGITPGDIRFSEVIEEIGGLRQESRVIPLILRASEAQDIYRSSLNATKETEADVAKGRQTLIFQFKELQANFQNLVQEMTADTAFQVIARSMLATANAAITLTRELRPLVELLVGISAFRVGSLAARGIKDVFKSENFSKGLFGFPFADGGVVPGSGNRDNVPARLMPGEFVLNKGAAKSIGYGNLARANKYAKGGKAYRGTGGLSALDSFIAQQGESTDQDNLAIEFEKMDKWQLLADDYVNNIIPGSNGINDRKNIFHAFMQSQREGRLPVDFPIGNLGSLFATIAAGKEDYFYNESRDKKSDTRQKYNDLLSKFPFVKKFLRRGKKDKFATGGYVGGYGNLARANKYAKGGKAYKGTGGLSALDSFIAQQGESTDQDNLVAQLVGMDKWQLLADHAANVTQNDDLHTLIFNKLLEFKKSGGLREDVNINDLARLFRLVANTDKQSKIHILSRDKDGELRKTLNKLLKNFPSIKKILRRGKLDPFATGGYVGGSGNTDNVPALLTPGEFVINKASAQRIGYSTLGDMNKYADGGIVKMAKGGKTPKKGGFGKFIKELPRREYSETIDFSILKSAQIIENFNVELKDTTKEILKNYRNAQTISKQNQQQIAQTKQLIVVEQTNRKKLGLLENPSSLKPGGPFDRSRLGGIQGTGSANIDPNTFGPIGRLDKSDRKRLAAIATLEKQGYSSTQSRQFYLDFRGDATRQSRSSLGTNLTDRQAKIAAKVEEQRLKRETGTRVPTYTTQRDDLQPRSMSARRSIYRRYRIDPGFPPNPQEQFVEGPFRGRRRTRGTSLNYKNTTLTKDYGEYGHTGADRYNQPHIGGIPVLPAQRKGLHRSRSGSYFINGQFVDTGVGGFTGSGYDPNLRQPRLARQDFDHLGDRPSFNRFPSGYEPPPDAPPKRPTNRSIDHTPKLREFGKGLEGATQKFAGIQLGLFALQHVTDSLIDYFGLAGTAAGDLAKKLSGGIVTAGSAANVVIAGLDVFRTIKTAGGIGNIAKGASQLFNKGKKVVNQSIFGSTTKAGLLTAPRAGLSGLAARGSVAGAGLGARALGVGGRLGLGALSGPGIAAAIGSILIESISSLDLNKDLDSAIGGGDLNKARKRAGRISASEGTFGISELIPNLISGVGTIAGLFSTNLKDSINVAANAFGDLTEPIFTLIPGINKLSVAAKKRAEEDIDLARSTREVSLFINSGGKLLGKNTVNAGGISSGLLKSKELLSVISQEGIKSTKNYSGVPFQRPGGPAPGETNPNDVVKRLARETEINEAQQKNVSELLKSIKPELENLALSSQAAGLSFSEYLGVLEENIAVTLGSKDAAHEFIKVLVKDSGKLFQQYDLEAAGRKSLSRAIESNIKAYVEQESRIKKFSDNLDNLNVFGSLIDTLSGLVSGNVTSDLAGGLNRKRGNNVGSTFFAGAINGSEGLKNAQEIQAIDQGRGSILNGLQNILKTNDPKDFLLNQDKIIKDAIKLVDQTNIPEEGKDELRTLLGDSSDIQKFQENVEKTSESLDRLKEKRLDPLEKSMSQLDSIINKYRNSLIEVTNAQIDYRNSVAEFESGSRQDRLSIAQLNPNFGIQDITSAKGQISLNDDVAKGFASGIDNLLGQKDKLVRGISDAARLRGAGVGGAKPEAASAVLSATLAQVESKIKLQANEIQKEIGIRAELIGILKDEAEVEKQRSITIRSSLEELGLASGGNARKIKKTFELAEKIQGGADFNSLSRREKKLYGDAIRLVDRPSEERIRGEARQAGLAKLGINPGSSFGADVSGAANTGLTGDLAKLMAEIGAQQDRREALQNEILNSQFQNFEILSNNITTLNDTMNGLFKTGIKMVLDTTNVVVTLTGKDLLAGLAPEVKAGILKEVQVMIDKEINGLKAGK